MKKRDRQKDRYNWYVCVSQDPEQIEHLKETCKNFKRWFYIEHKPDHQDGKPHIHVMVMYVGSCYLRTCARLLDIPEQMVQFCDSYRAYGQYMIHKNNDEKIKYNSSDVKTNVPGFYKALLSDTSDSDFSSLYGDLNNLRLGIISVHDFIDSHYSELQSMPFYQKIKMFEALDRLQNVRTT